MHRTNNIHNTQVRQTIFVDGCTYLNGGIRFLHKVSYFNDVHSLRALQTRTGLGGSKLKLHLSFTFTIKTEIFISTRH